MRTVFVVVFDLSFHTCFPLSFFAGTRAMFCCHLRFVQHVASFDVILLFSLDFFCRFYYYYYYYHRISIDIQYMCVCICCWFFIFLTLWLMTPVCRYAISVYILVYIRFFYEHSLLSMLLVFSPLSNNTIEIIHT